jgi:hypothetical protein
VRDEALGLIVEVARTPGTRNDDGRRHTRR